MKTRDSADVVTFVYFIFSRYARLSTPKDDIFCKKLISRANIIIIHAAADIAQFFARAIIHFVFQMRRNELESCMVKMFRRFESFHFPNKISAA